MCDDWAHKYDSMVFLHSTLSLENKEEDDGGENGKKAIGLTGKTTILPSHHAFLYIVAGEMIKKVKKIISCTFVILPPLHNRTHKTAPGGMGASVSQDQETLY